MKPVPCDAMKATQVSIALVFKQMFFEKCNINKAKFAFEEGKM